MPVITGELRDSYGYTWTLQGTFATRAHEKRLNATAERLLSREAEPWAALSALAARRGDSSGFGRSSQPLLEAAWKTLLEAHPHDTLCGCSIDEVAQAMQLRLRSASNQARGIAHDAILALLGHDPAAAREARDRWQPIVVVRNAAPRPRGGVALLEIEEFVRDVPVGPGSAPHDAAPTAPKPGRAPTIPGLGRVQLLSQSLQTSRIDSSRHYPDDDLVVASRVAAWVGEVPAYGLSSYAIGGRPPRRQPTVEPVVVGARGMENGTLTVAVGPDGRVSLDALGRTRGVAPLFELADDVDIGDLYTPAPRVRPFTVRFNGVRRDHNGPWRGQLALDYTLYEAARGRRAVIARVRVHLILDAGTNVLRVHVSGSNLQPDHRLRIVFHGDCAGGELWADAAFGPVRRDPIVVSDADRAVETAPPTAPLHRYLSRFSGARGITLFSDGLGEYEAMDDGSIAVTLVRAVGELSRNDLPERPGHAGWPSPTPLAQCIGPFAAEFGVLLHGGRGDETIGEIERAADDFLQPLTGTTLRSALALPNPVPGVALAGATLGFSAIKPSEDGEWLVLRCVNLSDAPAGGAWRLPFAAREARLARLDETPMSVLAIANDTVEVHVHRPRTASSRCSFGRAVSRDREGWCRPRRQAGREAYRRAACRRAR